MWAFFIKVALSILSFIESALLAAKQKGPEAQGIDELSMPTAEDRPISYFAGRVKNKGPNCIYYGNLKTKPIKQAFKIFGIKITETVIGHEYFLDFMYGIGYEQKQHSGEYVKIENVWYDGELIATGDFTSTNTKFGDVSRSIPNDKELQLDTYDLPGLSKLWFDNFKISENTLAIKKLDVEQSRYPQPFQFGFGITDTDQINYLNSISKIGVEANPAFIIADLLMCYEQGAGVDHSKIIVDDLISMAQTLYDEGFGLSIKIDNRTSVKQIIENILTHVDGFIRYDESGRIGFKLMRDNADLGNLFTIDESNTVSVSGLARNSVESKVREVKVSFKDRDSEYTDRTVSAANIGITSGIIKELNFPFVRDRGLAQRIANRELMRLSYQSAALAVEMPIASIHDVNVGQVVKFTNADYGINQQIYRIHKINYGKQSSSTMTVHLIQNFSSIDKNVQEFRTDWQPINTSLTAPQNAFIFELPPAFTESNEYTEAVALVARPDSISFGFENNSQQASYVSSFVLNEDLSATAGSVQVTQEDNQDVDLSDIGGRLAVIASGTYGQYEIVSVSSISGNTMYLKRGLLHSIPGEHEAGTRVFMMDSWLKVAELTSSAQSSISEQVRGYNLTKKTDFVTISGQAQGIHATPYPVQKLTAQYVIDEAAGDRVVIKFAHLDFRSRDNATVLLTGATSQTLYSADHVFDIVIKDSAGVDIYSGEFDVNDIEINLSEMSVAVVGGTVHVRAKFGDVYSLPLVASV
jgi:hypothetical protein